MRSSSTEMAPEDIQPLISSAEGAMAHAHASYSGFKVGAAILTYSGKTYTGCNIENPSLTQSACAERVALLKALSEGEDKFKAIAIVANDGRFCFPCGSCRQLLHEFAPGITLYLKSNDRVEKYTAAELLPHPFEERG